jgi:hypothetical protein
MPTVLLRSVCCGIAAAVVSVPGYFVAMILWALWITPHVPVSEKGNGEVGWDLLTMFDNLRPGVGLAWLLAAFAIGFFVGFRYFSERSSPQTV